MAKTYFISGYGNATEDDFKAHYEEKVFKAINEDALFVVGDYDGLDLVAQRYLKAMMVTNVTVYHMGEEPKRNVGFRTVGGFLSHEERDGAMTISSDEDIAWVRPDDKTSCTFKNIQRRKSL